MGGGAVEITGVDGWRVSMTGQAHVLLVECDAVAEDGVRRRLEQAGVTAGRLASRDERDGRVSLLVEVEGARSREVAEALRAIDGAERVREVPPVAYANLGVPLFTSAATMLELAESRDLSLGRLALAYESQLLGLSEGLLIDEMARRFAIMREAVQRGITEEGGGLQLLEPPAPRIMRADRAGRLAIGGLHTRAAARARWRSCT